MIKKLIAFVAIALSLGANAAVIHPEWRFSEEGLLQADAAGNLAWIDATLEQLTHPHPVRLASTLPSQDFVSLCDLDNSHGCYQQSLTQFSPLKSKMAYTYQYNHYTIANWSAKNNKTSAAEPVVVLLFFIGFVGLFFRNLRRRIKARYVHHFPVVF